MDKRKALRVGARILFFPVVGFAWGSMKRSGRLMRGEFARTAENTKLVGELFSDARKRVFGPMAAPAEDIPGESFADAMARRPGAETRAYIGFLTRKRVALCMAMFFLAIGSIGVARGAWAGLMTVLVGGGLSLEFAWLAEFRLWQLRSRKLSATEGGTLRDFWMEDGAWRSALHFERGFGLGSVQRAYRRWLWAKRAALSITLLWLLAAVDLFLSRSAHWTGNALAAAALGLSIAMIIELRLVGLRREAGMRRPVMAWIRFESGACYEELTA